MPSRKATFSDASYGFRPGRNAHQALRQARQYVVQGKRWVVDMDLEKFFGRVNHEAKSAVARPWQRKFLGYSLTWRQRPKLRIAKPSRQKLTEKVRALLRGAHGRNLVTTIQTLNPVLRGWAAYFKLTETKGALEDRDGWIRHKLRCILWRQWKRPYARARNMMKRGLTEERAWRSATNGRGPWWNAGASHMNAAFPKSWFDHLGLVSLLDTVQRLQRVS